MVCLCNSEKTYGTIQLKQSKGIKAGVILMLVIIAVYAVGSLLSSPIINAKKYQNLVTPENGDLTEDIQEISFNQMPLLDKDSAVLLGNRKNG